MIKASWPGRQARFSLATLALLALPLMVGCAAETQMTDLWHDESLAPGSIHTVLVIGLRKNPVRRRVWEDAFVKDLTARGITATASYTIFADASPDTQDVIDAVRKSSYDAVLTSVRLPDQEVAHFVPGLVRPLEVNSTDYYGRFHTHWVSVQDPGYTETDTIIGVQTDVWATSPGTGHLVWSGTLRTVESINPHSVDHAVAAYIMPEMEAQKLVPQKTR